ncbi:unnamed protein product [Clavelina lepadiformis]|uniref:Uncharacterized protein n=1 Tax=Clavelina lepadiformis TaxID=159417 RepID=A0ABP0GH71_CLALP
MISESELEEPMINSVHKRTKQIPYASTLDPDEKVNVWLASTPNQKGHKYKPPASPGESTGTATHTITRPLPRNQRDNPENVSSQQENLAVGRTARTIKQTRKLPSTTQPVLPVTGLLIYCEDKTKDKPRCQQEFYEPTGEVNSPSFPENYPDDAECIYRILTNKIVNISFESFSIEQSEDCKYDFINVVFNASSPTSKPQRYCGDGLDKVEGGSLRGAGPLIVAFISDESDTMQGFKFKYQIELNGPDPCASNPCQHGGSCATYPEYYLCECPDGYAGINCEKNIDDCASFPCENGGQCTDYVGKFTCSCINNFTGDVCEIRPVRCTPNPCDNGGLCVDRGKDHVCSCPKDFMGDLCEIPIPTPPQPTQPSTTATPGDKDGNVSFPEENDDTNSSPTKIASTPSTVSTVSMPTTLPGR